MCLPRTGTNPSLPPTISLIPTKAMGCGAAGPPAVHPFTQDQERPMKLLHIDSSVLDANSVSRQLTRSAVEELAFGEELLAEFLAADVVVLGAPMYNFTIPSQLKAWLDRVLVAGRTFKYTESGPVGLAGGKKVVIVSSRGGIYSPGTPAEALDHQESYLKVALGFMGITDITVVRAEGVNMEERREQAISAAHAELRGLFGLPAAA